MYQQELLYCNIFVKYTFLKIHKIFCHFYYKFVNIIIYNSEVLNSYIRKHLQSFYVKV